MNALKKSRLEQAIVIVLLAVFSFTFLRALRQFGLWGNPDRRVAAAQADRQARPTPSVVPTAEPESGEAGRVGMAEPVVKAVASRVSPRYSAEDQRDPFASLLPPEEEPSREMASTRSPRGRSGRAMAVAAPIPPELPVQGVSLGATGPRAIIANEVYKIGDVVGGVTITAIDRRGVTVEFYGSSLTYPVLTVTDGAGSPQSMGAYRQGAWR